MSKLDRLSALIDRFELSVEPASADEANLLIWPLDAPEEGWRLIASTRTPIPTARRPARAPAFSARFFWGGADNPLLGALGEGIDRSIAPGDDLDMLARLLASERAADRCGAASALNKLGEVLMIRLLRDEIARGGARPGLLGALADPRLARAVVAMHEAPGRDWRNDDLADIAGLSRSRFAELFQAAIGEGPSAYLRRWRLALARRDVARGDQVQTVARRYGYRSGEALNRAFHRFYDQSPREIRAGAEA